MRLAGMALLTATLWGQATFRTTTQLVVETVTVKDKNGRPVTGLTAKDFVLTEDGVAQEIKFFEFQQLAEPVAAPPVAGPVEALARLTRGDIAGGDVRYRDKRLLALYFDLTAMPGPDQVRAFRAAKIFVQRQMTSADLVAVMVFQGGSVRVLHDFTEDRGRLLRVIETLLVGEDENAPVDPATSADAGAAFGQNDTEFDIFFTDRQLSALQTAAAMLGRLQEKKALVYFASGLRLNGTNNQAQLQATINAAVRAGVAFWPIDARGLVASAPMGDATQGSPGGAGMYTGATANAQRGNLQRSQDTLWTLAADTGGKALLDSNDLGAGIVQAQKSTESYYILGYYSTNEKTDGKFRKVKILLAGGREGIVEYRQGYYGNKIFSKFSSADKERHLEDALRLGDPVTELPIALEVGYFQLNSAEYYVPVMVKIPGSELALARRGGAERALIDFLGEVKDEYGTTVSNVRDKVELRLTGATAAELARRPIEYDTGMTLLPGQYKLKLLARDTETGRMGTYERAFIVPNLAKETRRIPISSVVLSSQRVDMREAIFNASKDKTQMVNPMVWDGKKIIPSVTRVFRITKDLFVYFQAYQGGETVEPVAAYLTLFRNGEKALETAPVVVAEGGTNRLKALPVRFEIPLGKLSPGEYICQVTVLESKGAKAAFWQAPLVLVP